jgi:hypothetical protein
MGLHPVQIDPLPRKPLRLSRSANVIRYGIGLKVDQQYYDRDIERTVREPLLVLDSELRVKSPVDLSTKQTFNVSPDQTLGRILYQLGNG